MKMPTTLLMGRNGTPGTCRHRVEALLRSGLLVMSSAVTFRVYSSVVVDGLYSAVGT